MIPKRKFTQGENDQRPIYKKKSRLNDLCSNDEPRIDPTYGQRGAFPGLDDSHTNDELFYGPANDGLEYLRMVRSEAKTVPNLLVAPSSPTTPSEKDNLYADYAQGYYHDGAYTAIPDPRSKTGEAPAREGQQEDPDPQELYYASLRSRFTKVTESLQSPPPRAASDNTSVYYLDWTRPRLWRWKLLSTTPTMVVLAQLTQESVICGLGVLESLLRFANLSGKRGRNIGAWTWGLLGKCREVGQMGSEEVGVLRNLGKQAVWLLRRLSAGEVIGGTADEPDAEEEGEEELGEEEDEQREEGIVEDDAEAVDTADADDGNSLQIDTVVPATSGPDSNSDAQRASLVSDADLAKAKQHILNHLGDIQAQIDSTETNDGNEEGTRHPTTNHHHHPLPESKSEAEAERKSAEREVDKEMIHATLDMLITIVGEFYGQRDLLGGRLLWDEMQ